jgi:MtfA peptidase
MADTTYFQNAYTVTYDSLPDSIKQLIEMVHQQQQTETSAQVNYKTPESDPGYTPFIIVMVAFIALGVVAVKRAWKSKGSEILGGWMDKRETTGGIVPVEKYNNADEKFNDLTKGYFVYHGHDLTITDERYEKTLQKHSVYYRGLSPELKEIFLKRTKAFLRDKTFLIKSNDTFIEMPVLLSAAAVQLTFGLDKYQLPHYQYIRIFREEYFASDDSLRVLAGHVYGNTITVSWNHFLDGFGEYTDGVNLGLHEMAHALYFQLAEADSGRCRKFIANFEAVMQEGKEAIRQIHTRPSELYKENAYRNLQEFWAESVELFFERPSELKRENNDIYEAMKEILNQDPLNNLYPLSDA